MDFGLAPIEPFKISYEDIASQDSNRKAYRVLNKKRYPSVSKIKDIVENIKSTKVYKSKNYHRSTPTVIADIIFFPERIQALFEPDKEEYVEKRKPVRSGMAWLKVKNEWKTKFATSEFAKTYKSLDEFATFASNEECQHQ
jgi:hypothetical protein